MTDLVIDWKPPGPIAEKYLHDDTFICGIRGPFGSAKSVTSIVKLAMNAQLQRRYPDGWRRRRTLITRNTSIELKTTTIKTWEQWIPKSTGHWRDTGPPRHYIRDIRNKFEWEILFVAFDAPDDVAKALSMDLSDCWVNEAREVHKAVIDGLMGRVGRFPRTIKNDKGEVMHTCDNAQLLLDTNSPDTEHWWYCLAERDGSTERNRQMLDSMDAAEATLREMGVLRPNQKLMSFHAQPSGLSKEAENLDNLRAGYYQFLCAGKTDDWIKVYVHGEYGFSMDGLAVHPGYRESTHCREFPLIKGLPIRCGADWGLTPAGVITQRLPNGRWLVHDEYTSERMGITTFAEEFKRKLSTEYADYPIASFTGDPAGDAMNPDESTCFSIMRTAGFKNCRPAPTNDPTRRREALDFLLRTIIDGEPAILIHPRCKMLRKGLMGGYQFKRIQTTGDHFRDVADKNMFSHVVEALHYDLLAAGEDRNVTLGKGPHGMKVSSYATDYPVFS
jgi:hypothetical protein